MAVDKGSLFEDQCGKAGNSASTIVFLACMREPGREKIAFRSRKKTVRLPASALVVKIVRLMRQQAFDEPK